MFAYRFADTGQKRPRHRFTGDHTATPRLTLGYEYNAAVDELGFRGTWVAHQETPRVPMIHLNTSSDRIGTPEGDQQYSVTFAKAVRGTTLAPYFSITYSEFEDGLVFPFGANWQIAPQWGLLLMNDGRRPHALLTYSQRDWYAQIGWIWFERIAFSLGWGF